MRASLKPLTRLLRFEQHSFFQPIAAGGHVHETEAFRIMLQRERALVDRNEHSFSVIMLTSPTRRHPAFKRTLSYLIGRIRATDDIGWMNRTELGILLRCTDHEGAARLAASLVAEGMERKLSIVCRTYTYPVNHSDAGGGDGSPTKGEDKEKETPRSVRGSRGQRREGRAQPPAALPDTPTQSATHTTATTYRTPSDGAGICESMLGNPVRLWKRASDIAIALLALTLLSPVMLALAVFIKIVSPGPVFFRQERIGYLGRPFTCWKFRTMKPQADTGVHQAYLKTLIQSGGAMVKLDLKKDQRLIPFAKLIRASGLDELPQLLNVLRGEMSVIGPRPCIRYEYEQFEPWHRQRFTALPGLTGLWQVSGKNRTTFLEMMRMDIGYATRPSPWRDLSIMLKTVPAVIGETTRVVEVDKATI